MGNGHWPLDTCKQHSPTVRQLDIQCQTMEQLDTIPKIRQSDRALFNGNTVSHTLSSRQHGLTVGKLEIHCIIIGQLYTAPSDG